MPDTYDMTMKLHRYILITALLVLLETVAAPSAVSKEEGEDGIREQLSAIKGADMTIYSLYCNEDDYSKKMRCAGIFLSGLDSAAANTALAVMNTELADWYENEKFLFSKAIQYREQSLRIYTALDSLDKIADTKYCLARLYYKKGLYHNALKYIYDALDDYTALGDKVGRAECYNIMGILYHICKDYEKSKACFSKYAENANELNDSLRMVLALNNSAAFEHAMSDSVKSETLIAESLELCRNLKDTARLCTVLQNLIGISVAQGKYEEAEQYFSRIRPLLNNIELKANYNLSRGNLYRLKGQYDSAAILIEKAITYYEQGEFDRKRMQCYLLLENVYSMSGDTDKAYKALRNYYGIENSADRNDVFLELFRAQNDIILQHDRENLLRQQNKWRTLTLTAIFIVLVTALVIYIYYYRKSEQIKKNERELRSKTEMLELKKMQNYQMEQMAKSIVDKLKKLCSGIKEQAVRNRIQDICNELSSTKDEKQWKELSQYIPEFNSDFYNALIKDFPNLTINERRLCSLLNMNLTTKEISEITRQSPKSINMARTRLRGKLGLTDSGISIHEFLAKYN